MQVTLSVIKADIGGYVGHSSSRPDVLERANKEIEKAKKSGILIYYHVTRCGDDLQLIMTHQHGEDIPRYRALSTRLEGTRHPLTDSGILLVNPACLS